MGINRRAAIALQPVRVVTDEMAKALAREYGVMYVETSAKDNYNVNEAFMQLATAIKNVADQEAAAAATGDGVVIAAAPTGDGSGEVQPLVLTGKPVGGSSSGGCC